MSSTGECVSLHGIVLEARLNLTTKAWQLLAAPDGVLSKRLQWSAIKVVQQCAATGTRILTMPKVSSDCQLSVEHQEDVWGDSAVARKVVFVLDQMHLKGCKVYSDAGLII